MNIVFNKASRCGGIDIHICSSIIYYFSVFVWKINSIKTTTITTTLYFMQDRE